MKMKKFWKRFFTMNRTGADGFTLVELIVVIAILAILGGVAVPAYSGYVAKAEEAADNALLAEVNTAFAAACAINGESHIGQNATATLTDGVVTAVNPHKDTFMTFFDSKTAAFKTVDALAYDNKTGMFGFGVNVMYGNTPITVSKSDVEKLLGSTWAERLTAQELLGLVDGTLEKVENMYDETYLKTVFESGNFKDAASKALGEDYDAYLEKQVEAKAKAEYEAANPGKSWDALSENRRGNYMESVREGVESDLNSNMAVLVAAQGAQSQKDAVMNILTTNPAGAKEFFKGNLSGEGDPTIGLSQAAVAYGLYSSYVLYQNPGKTLDELNNEGLLSPSKAWGAFDDESFQQYLTGQGQKDLDGLMASMNVISGQDSTVVGNVMQNGVTDSNLQSALQQILGK